MTSSLLPLERWLDQAQRQYLLSMGQQTTFRFTIRYDQSLREQVLQLESFLMESRFLRVVDYRQVREGYTKVARASQVEFDLTTLIEFRPESERILEDILRAKEVLGNFDWSDFLDLHYAECLAKSSVLADGIRVLDYLQQHRETVCGKYVRQVGHGRSTKLLGKESLLLKLWKRGIKQGVFTEVSGYSSFGWKEFFAHFDLRTKPLGFAFWIFSGRYFESELKEFLGLIHHETIGAWDFSSVEFALVVENEETFYAMQVLGLKTLLIWGEGKKVGAFDFLPTLTCPVFYWGDIDVEGYHAYESFCRAQPNPVISVGMDFATMRAFSDRMQCHSHPSMQKSVHSLMGESEVMHLSEKEFVAQNQLQIEQEQIPLDWVVKLIKQSPQYKMKINSTA